MLAPLSARALPLPCPPYLVPRGEEQVVPKATDIPLHGLLTGAQGEVGDIQQVAERAGQLHLGQTAVSSMGMGWRTRHRAVGTGSTCRMRPSLVPMWATVALSRLVTCSAVICVGPNRPLNRSTREMLLLTSRGKW